MALYQATVTTAPVDISALLGVARGVSKECRGINLGQRPVYRAVASTPPSDLDGPVWRYSPGEAFNLILYAGFRWQYLLANIRWRKHRYLRGRAAMVLATPTSLEIRQVGGATMIFGRFAYSTVATVSDRGESAKRELLSKGVQLCHRPGTGTPD